MSSGKKGFVPSRDSKRPVPINWRRLGPSGFAIVGDHALPFLKSASECTTASNYVKGKVADALGVAGAVISEVGDAIEKAGESLRGVPAENAVDKPVEMFNESGLAERFTGGELPVNL